MSQELEKRRFKRVGTEIPLKLEVHQWKGEGAFQGQSMEGTLYDVSEGGLKIRSMVPLAIDMFMKIILPQDSGLPTLIGRIIRCDVLEEGKGYEYGCMVTGLSLIDRRHLEMYMNEVK
jgi:hypothetical protein